MRVIALALQRGNVEPSPLGPALETQLRELDPFGAFEKVPSKGHVVEQMTNEQFPLDLECVAVDLVGRDLLPGIEKVDRLRNVWVPYRLRSIDACLRPAIGQTRDRGAERSIDVKSGEIVATHARLPGAVDLGDHASVRAGELEGRVCGVVRGRIVFASLLVPALRDMRRADTRNASNFAPEIIEHVAPVAEHVDDDSAVIFLAIVPRRALRGLPVAFEHPIPEFAPHG